MGFSEKDIEACIKLGHSFKQINHNNLFVRHAVKERLQRWFERAYNWKF